MKRIAESKKNSYRNVDILINMPTQQASKHMTTAEFGQEIEEITD